jgi:hypothetical protein
MWLALVITDNKRNHAFHGGENETYWV